MYLCMYVVESRNGLHEEESSRPSPARRRVVTTLSTYVYASAKIVNCVGNIDPLVNVVRYSRELHESMSVTYVCIYIVVYIAVCMYLCMYIVESRDGLHDTCDRGREFTY